MHDELIMDLLRLWAITPTDKRVDEGDLYPYAEATITRLQKFLTDDALTDLLARNDD
ncbi:hypothetical protein [Hyphomicrobium sp.]|uniref:hypothetical protein n=1 Tax=Hyphomicrobium sp. TaxID=82 RepID=UPI001DE605BA|nr:hypothetical protein [Hyphomicrobium sp.]MBY0561447.1 hypothetical protein [Hyphomicrobium sp.]